MTRKKILILSFAIISLLLSHFLIFHFGFNRGLSLFSNHLAINGAATFKQAHLINESKYEELKSFINERQFSIAQDSLAKLNFSHRKSLLQKNNLFFPNIDEMEHVLAINILAYKKILSSKADLTPSEDEFMKKIKEPSWSILLENLAKKAR